MTHCLIPTGHLAVIEGALTNELGRRQEALEDAPPENRMMLIAHMEKLRAARLAVIEARDNPTNGIA